MERTKTLVITFLLGYALIVSGLWYRNLKSYERTIEKTYQQDLSESEAKKAVKEYNSSKSYYSKTTTTYVYTKTAIPWKFNKVPIDKSIEYFSKTSE